MQTSFDAVVIGAGPAGSSAAALLAQAGWSVALIERQGFPRRKVCGECIAASNLPLLDALGLGAAFAAAAGPELRRVALMQGGRSIVADLPRAAGVHGWGRALGRESLDALLLECARSAGAVVLQPWSALQPSGTFGVYRVPLRASAHGAEPAAATLQARVLIDAHGCWQTLDTVHDRERRRRGSDLLAFKANFERATLAPGLLPVLIFRGGYGGIVVADGGVTTLACCIRRDRFATARRATPGARAGEVIEALLRRECSGVDAALGPAQRRGPWLAAGPLAPGIRISVRDNHFRIGNAAGEAHPIIGEGISMALQSAWLLCSRLLACGGDPPDAAPQRLILAAYARHWRHEFAPRLRLAAVCAQLAMRPAALPLLALITRRPQLLTSAAAWGGKLHCAADSAMITRLGTSPSTRQTGDIMTTLERLRAILIRDYKLDASRLTPDAPLEDLGIDSLGVAELLFNVEDEFKISLPPEPVQLPTLADVVRYIDALVAAQRTAAGGDGGAGAGAGAAGAAGAAGGAGVAGIAVPAAGPGTAS